MITFDVLSIFYSDFAYILYAVKILIALTSGQPPSIYNLNQRKRSSTSDKLPVDTLMEEFKSVFTEKNKEFNIETNPY